MKSAAKFANLVAPLVGLVLGSDHCLPVPEWILWSSGMVEPPIVP